VRSYQLWYKIDLAWRLINKGYKLADIATLSGFFDTAHMCHIFQDAFGVPISYHLDKMKIKTEYSLPKKPLLEQASAHRLSAENRVAKV